MTSAAIKHRAGKYIINLDAGVKITASDGASRVIGVGEVILVEDTAGSKRSVRGAYSAASLIGVAGLR